MLLIEWGGVRVSEVGAGSQWETIPVMQVRDNGGLNPGRDEETVRGRPTWGMV